MAEITANDSTLIVVIRKNFSSEDVLYDKRGELSSQRVIVADLALLRKGDKTYLLAIYAYRNSSNSEDAFEELKKGVEDISRLFWNYSEGK